MLKDNTQVNINCSKLARQYGCDRRTVSKAINAVKNNLPQPKVNKPRKTDGFELIIEEKLKTGAPAIAICNYITKHHGYTGSYTTIADAFQNCLGARFLCFFCQKPCTLCRMSSPDSRHKQSVNQCREPKNSILMLFLGVKL